MDARQFICLVALFLLSFPLQAQTQSAKGRYDSEPDSKVRLCVDPDWMPLERINEQGEHVGILAEHLRLIAHNAGLELVLQPTNSWVETLEAFRAGRCDLISGLNYSAEREAEMAFTAPYLRAPMVIVSRSGEGPIEELSELNGKRLVSVHGYWIGQAIQRDYAEIEVVFASSIERALTMVGENAAYAAVGSALGMSYTINRLNPDGLRVIGHTDYRGEYRIGVTKGNPRLLARLNRGIASISREESDRIVSRWVTLLRVSWFDYAMLWRLSAVAALILLGVLYRQWLISSANRELAEAHQRLQRAYREQDTLIRMFSHEYRTPLSILSSGLNLMRREAGSADHGAIKRLDMMERAVGRLKNLIDGTLSTLDSSKDHAAGDCALSTCLRECVETHRAANPGREIVLEACAELRLGLPESALQSCVDNLIGNAIKYSSGPVRVEAVREDGHCSIRVTDQGAGIPEALHQRVFEKFYRAPGAEAQPGTGLGLHVVATLVERYGGNVHLRSGEGEGCCFRLDLPVVDEVGGGGGRGARA